MERKTCSSAKLLPKRKYGFVTVLLSTKLRAKATYRCALVLLLGSGIIQTGYAQGSCLNFSAANAYPTGGTIANSVAAADLNGDGHPDLAIAHESTGNVGVLFNNGNGSFVLSGVYPSGGSLSYSVAAGDFDGDGIIDLAVANNGGSGDIGVLINNGNGTFAAAAAYSTNGSQATSVAVGDFNGDGNLDITAANHASASVSILLNSGSGIFTTGVPYSSGGTQPRTVAAGDLNGDGKTDLIAANNSTHTIGVLLNNGGGSFGPAVTYPAGANYPAFIALGDFNSDNKADLAVTNEAGVSVLMGNGNGSFAAAALYPASFGTLAAGDLNGDGIPDLAAPVLNSSYVQVLLNNGNGTFAAPAITFHSGGAGSHSLAIKDLNGDGKNDLAVSNFSSNSVGILVNSSTCCFNPGFTFTAPANPVPKTSAVTLTINHTNNNLEEVLVNWGDGTGPQAVSFLPSSFTVSHTYSGAGVYTIVVSMKNLCGLTTTKEYKYVVVYDPSAGFIAGAGFIHSPAGAYISDPDLSGNALFGLTSRYQKGQTQPMGNTRFEFKVAGLDFKSTLYDWLVVSGAKAQFKGSGTINGLGDYGFLVSAVDGDVPQNATSDKFRIKIWNKTTNNVVYDNQPGDAEDAVATTSIAGGAIVIQSSNAQATTIAGVQQSARSGENNDASQLIFKASPNPSNNYFELNMQSQGSLPVSLRVLDILGRIIETRNNISASRTIRIGDHYQPGLYMVEAIRGKEKVVLKLIKSAN